MTTRSYFVSNSSTSSFILAFNDDQRKVCPHCERPMDNDVMALIDYQSLKDNNRTHLGIELTKKKDPLMGYLPEYQALLDQYDHVYNLEINYHSNLVKYLQAEGYYVKYIPE